MHDKKYNICFLIVSQLDLLIWYLKFSRCGIMFVLVPGWNRVFCRIVFNVLWTFFRFTSSDKRSNLISELPLMLFVYFAVINKFAFSQGPTWNGRSGVHTHMTNTRITDPEILELRYPIVLNKFHLRYGSGGNGAHYGGDGVVREMTFR